MRRSSAQGSELRRSVEEVQRESDPEAPPPIEIFQQ
jgi:hypothetical protein